MLKLLTCFGLPAVFFLLSASSLGCQLIGKVAPEAVNYGHRRVLDFLDIFRMEFRAGYGLQLGTKLGEVGHIGIGSSNSASIGWRYGNIVEDDYIVQYPPISYFNGLFYKDLLYLHWEQRNKQKIPEHLCQGPAPFTIHKSQYAPTNVHFLDIEADAVIGLLGFRIGFSVGELFDFIAGLVTIDIAKDDTDYDREKKRLEEPILKNIPPEQKTSQHGKN